jgi:hypothetical protein
MVPSLVTALAAHERHLQFRRTPRALRPALTGPPWHETSTPIVVTTERRDR